MVQRAKVTRRVVHMRRAITWPEVSRRRPAELWSREPAAGSAFRVIR